MTQLDTTAADDSLYQPAHGSRDSNNPIGKALPIESVTISGTELVCPICHAGAEGEHGNLHHRRVVSYMRAEDAKETLVAESSIDENDTCRAHEQNFPSEEIKNPSVRRSGIAIDFYCEQCYAAERSLQLVVYQHKGSTYIEWRTQSLHGV